MNKGAELMLHAILQKVGSVFPDASFAVTPARGPDYLQRARLGLYQKVRLQKWGVQWGNLGWLLPKALRQRYGLILDEEVQVVLDASGFAYSDQCFEYSSLAMASYVKAWKKRGTKIILLPQALGPFTAPSIRAAFAFVIRNADLVCPRDDISCKHVTDLVGERENVYQAPDFTNLVPGIMPEDPERIRGRVCFVPNYHMIDKTSHIQSSAYPLFCAECIKCLVRLDQRPFILVHEGEQDLRLAERIVQESNEDVDIVTETEALRIKGILGQCAAVISSRFHGLVSALSQGVPALATGWSHKYATLFKEYDIPDGCISIPIEPDTLQGHLKRILEGDSRNEIIARLTRASAMHRERTEMMWQKVISAIRK